jgi:uncharacterized membrane protein
VEASAASPLRQGRRQYIDWLRGVAVLVMIMWHSIDSWHTSTDRTTAAFLTIMFLAGWAAPLFLFLAGLSLALAGEKRVEGGVPRDTVAAVLARRGWQVFLLAHLFRFQSFVSNPRASWSAILKPDILNVLGLGLVITAYGWRRAVSPRQRLLWLLLPAIVVAVILAPWAPTWRWPTLLPPRLEAYIRPVGNQGVFSLFPTIGYVFAGGFVGVLLASGVLRGAEGRFHRSATLAGLALVAAGAAVETFWTMAAARWLQPAAVVAWRTGAMLVLLALSYWWLRGRTVSTFHPLVVFGQTSLFVYWVHVELAYGGASFALWRTLTLPWAVAAYLVLAATMYAAALVWLRRPSGAWVPEHLVASRSGRVRQHGV